MNFKIKNKINDPVPSEIPVLPELLLQSQNNDEPNSNKNRMLFRLAWKLDFEDNQRMISGWTPLVNPSITETISSRKDIQTLTILGHNVIGNYQIELARIAYRLVRGFGYIGETSFSNRQEIIGMWVRLTENRVINIYRNGQVKENSI